MSGILGGHLDMIIFSSGLASLLLALAAWRLTQGLDSRWPWPWLGLFAALQALGEWLRLALLVVEAAPLWTPIFLLLYLGAGLGLLSFVRLAGRSLGRWRGSRWPLLLALALAASGSWWGWGGFKAGVYGALILPAGLAAGLLLCTGDLAAAGPPRLPCWVGVGLCLFSLSSGLSWPMDRDFPALWRLEHSPWQQVLYGGYFLRSLSLWLAALVLWWYEESLRLAQQPGFLVHLRRLIRVGTVSFILILFLGGCLFTTLLGQRAQEEVITRTWQQIQQVELLLQQEMAIGSNLAETVASTAEVRTAFVVRDGGALTAANHQLDRYSRTFPNTVVYLMDLDGLTIASSNRYQQDSFVGQSYAFRPYFQMARQGQNGAYMALGATSLERGFYASAPVYDWRRQVIGVAVVKSDIDRLEAILLREPISFLVDGQGIIFLASRPDLVLKSLWPLSEAERQQIIASKQFGSGPWPSVLASCPQSGEIVRFQGGERLYLSKPIGEPGWQIVALGATSVIMAARGLGLALTIFLCLTFVGLLLVWETTMAASVRIGASERLYQSLIEGAPDCISLFDREGRFLTINPPGLQMFGRSGSEMAQLSLQQLCPPQQRCLVRYHFKKVAQGQKTAFAIAYQHPTGQTLALQIILNPILETDGQIRRIVGIISDITERQQIEADLHCRLRLEELIVRISTDFINLPPPEIDAGIERALATLGDFVGVDRVYIFQVHAEGRLTSNTHEWCRPGITAEKDNLQNLPWRDLFPWFSQTLERFQVVWLNRLADLPPTATAELAEFTRQGIQSLIAVPLLHQGQLLGFLGFDSVRQPRSWSAESVTILQMVGDIIVNALARQRADAALRLDEARLEALIQLGQMQARPFQEIISYALDEAVRLTRSQIGFLAFLDESETKLTQYAWSEETARQCSLGEPYLVHQVEQTGLWAEAIRQRRPLIINDYTAPHPLKKGLPPGHVPVQRFLALPVFAGERIVAVAGVGNKNDPYDDADVRQLTLLMDGMWKLIQQKQAAEALAAEKERLAVTLSSIGDAVIATDMAGKVQLMNHVAEELTGWSQAEALGQPVLQVCQLLDQSGQQPQEGFIPSLLAGQSLSEQTFLLLTREGRERLIAAGGAPIINQHQQVQGAVLVFRDITLQRSLETELLKAAKLHSLGLLAGGIAHDFNNILTAILGNLSLGLLQVEEGQVDGNLPARLRDAEKATLRARDLVQRLLTFAKGGAPVKRLASLQDIVEESAAFASSGSPSRCQFHLPPDLWHLEVDEGQISQVIQNLVINAVQAMPQGGNINLAAANVELPANSGLPLPPGRYVRLTVTDEGIGIPPDHLPHIFDPYFSTKQQGSGLGLSTVYAIVRNHEGHITVNSQLGHGTTFTIYLPASAKHLTSRQRPAMELAFGQGPILVMDDEPMVRDVVARMLRRLGYEVTTAADGQEALASYQEAMATSRPFVGVILDLTVPGGMGGKETLERLRELDPAVVALVSSGYAEDAIMTHYQEYGFRGVIKKPYRLEELGRALHQVLGRERKVQASSG